MNRREQSQARRAALFAAHFPTTKPAADLGAREIIEMRWVWLSIPAHRRDVLLKVAATECRETDFGGRTLNEIGAAYRDKRWELLPRELRGKIIGALREIYA